MVQPTCKGNEGVAVRFLRENPAAIPVHCFAHSLNLCLQGIGKDIICIRDASVAVKDTGKLIQLSPKRLHLFSCALQATEENTVSLNVQQDGQLEQQPLMQSSRIIVFY